MLGWWMAVASAGTPLAAWNAGAAVDEAVWGLAAGDVDGDGTVDGVRLVSELDPSGAVLVLEVATEGGTNVRRVPLDARGAGVLALGQLDADAELEIIVGLPDTDGDGLAGAEGQVRVLGRVTGLVHGAAVPAADEARWSGTLADRAGESVGSADPDGDGVATVLTGVGGRLQGLTLISGGGVLMLRATHRWTPEADGQGDRFGIVFAVAADQRSAIVAGRVTTSAPSVGLVLWTVDLTLGPQAVVPVAARSAELVPWNEPFGLVWSDDHDGDGLPDPVIENKPIYRLDATQGFVVADTGPSGSGPGISAVRPTLAGPVLLVADGVGGVNEYTTMLAGAGPGAVTDTWAEAGRWLAGGVDWDGDGCDDVLGSGRGTVWWIPGACAPPPDTDVETDSEPETDAETDSEVETDAESDTDPGDTDEVDTDVPKDCEPTFGWACASGGGGVSAAWLGVVAAWALRRRPTSRT